MGYGTNARQASRYREAEILSATPGQLVVLLYDHLLVTLTRVRHLSGAEHLSARSDTLEKCRAVITELRVTLDEGKGGEIAGRLASLYQFILSELTVMGIRPNVARLDRVIGIVQGLRDAFAQASQGVEPASRQAAAV